MHNLCTCVCCLPAHVCRVSSVGIQMEGECDMEKLNDWLSSLLQVRG